MGDLNDDVTLLKQRVGELEDWAANLAETHRRTTEELRQAAGRLEDADRRYRQLQDRYEDLAERHAALEREQDRQAMKISVAGGVFMGDLAS